MSKKIKITTDLIECINRIIKVPELAAMLSECCWCGDSLVIPRGIYNQLFNTEENS